MTPEQWSDVQAIFAAVLETSAENRAARIRELCRGDDNLVREVSTLLAADADASRRISPPAPAIESLLSTPDKPVPIGVRVGEYVVQGLLGRGGMGTVYAGIHPLIEKEVAIKVLDARLAANEGIVERFVREARAVNKIRHPNIIDIFAFGCSPELGHYFVMPRLVGETLGARIERSPLSFAELLPIVEQVTDALDAAHRAGVLHRDLKPDNVFLVPDRRGGVTVQVLDFGIAKLLDGNASVTSSGMQMGTPLFMSPEQWDAATVDERTDVYALGVMVHHALTGRFPFESSSPVTLMNMHANSAPTPASDHGAPPAVDRVIARALAKSRDDRPGSAGQFYAELAAVAGADPSQSARSSASGSAFDRPATSRGRMWVAVAGLLALGAVVVAAVTLGRREGDASTPVAPGVAPRHDARVAVPPPDTTPPPPVPPDAAAPVVDVQPLPRRPDARPRTPSDARAVTIDAAAPPPPRPDASAWGSTIDPFQDP